jgi:hypothetical protein
MTKVGLIKCFFLFFVVSTSFGQKVKYKDIFALLNAKQYEQAEPFLRKYIKDNDDNPNAFLFMGMTFQEKASKTDILKATRVATSQMDSAIFFYDKTLKLLTEKEVKRNDELYQMYNRRDLRTGEFGVRLSDIQFDLQKRIEGLRERIDRVKMVKYHFSLADSLYKKSNKLFKSIQTAYPGENEMFLRSDEKLIEQLKALSVRFDSCTKAFDHYKGSSSTLTKTGYNQVITLVEIRNFKSDGVSVANFYEDDLQLWDYKTFAEKTKDKIEKEIIPMREHLISYDIEINKLREKLTNDSVSVRNDLTKLIDKILNEQLKKYDAEPLPMEVFTLKTADLEYRSALIESKPFKDSTDVVLKLNLIKREMKDLNKLDSIATKLASQNMDEEIKDYEHFIANTYSNSIVLNSYIKALKEYAAREKQKKTIELNQRLEAMNWIVDQADSIPLSMTHPTKKFKPLALVIDKFTSGLAYSDSLSAQGYFYTIKTSRKPEVRVRFDVDKPGFKLSQLGHTKALTYSDAGGQIYFVLLYSDRANKEKFPATLAKIYRSDGLAWSTNYQLTFVPKEIQFKSDTGELTVKNDTQSTVIDKNGKILK